MGAYPDEAAEPGDRGLMSTAGQALIDGDLVVNLAGLVEPDDDGRLRLELTPKTLDKAEVSGRSRRGWRGLCPKGPAR